MEDKDKIKISTTRDYKADDVYMFSKRNDKEIFKITTAKGTSGKIVVFHIQHNTNDHITDRSFAMDKDEFKEFLKIANSIHLEDD